jgi:preprotein translocase subunit SecG
MVLLQAGKGGGLSGAFGGMGANQPFLGARGTADFLSKFTVYLAIAFMALSLVLSVLYGTNRAIVKEKAPEVTDTQATEAEATTTQTSPPATTTTPKPTTSGSAGNTQKPASTPTPSPSGQ